MILQFRSLACGKISNDTLEVWRHAADRAPRDGLCKQIADMLINISDELYEDDPEMLDAEVGFTAAAITQLCRELGVPIYIKWQNCKLESYTPEHTQYESVALYVQRYAWIPRYCRCVWTE